MDTSDPEITFDDEGNCNHCREFLRTRAAYVYRGEESDATLSRAIESIQTAGKGKPFDCIIGISGGVDSSYLLYTAKQKGLRPLAVHLDNGWDSETAVSNIQKVVSKLDLDYESYVLNWEEFRGLQLAFLRASVPEAETPTDVAIVGALHHFAAKYGIKYMISAGNQATEGILPKSWHYNARDLKYFNHITSTFGAKRLRTFPTFGYQKEIYFKFIKGISTLYLLNYVPYDHLAAIQLLDGEFDYHYYGQKHYESRYTRFIQSYYLFEKFGIDYRRATYSAQICSGQIGREEALEGLGSKPYCENAVDEEKEYVAKKLGITREELERIIDLAPKWYWDYPNDDRKLGIIYSAYRKLFNKEKLASV
jgi:N-acetyl sugar amidotransferase